MQPLVKEFSGQNVNHSDPLLIIPWNTDKELLATEEPVRIFFFFFPKEGNQLNARCALQK